MYASWGRIMHRFDRDQLEFAVMFEFLHQEQP